MKARHFIFFPGYVILWIAYMFPTEWGKSRNTAGSSRRWTSRDTLAPVLATIIYAVVIGLLFFMRSGAWDVLKAVWNDSPNR